MEESKSGGAKDSAGRPVSKLLISSSHAVVKDHHGSFTYQVPNNDQIHCDTPCYVGVSDLQVPVLGPAMANVVHGVNDKLDIYVAQSGTSNPNLSFHIITIPAGQYSASSLRLQLETKLDAVDVPVGARYSVSHSAVTNRYTISQVSGTGHGFGIYDAHSLLTAPGYGSGNGIAFDEQQSMQDILNIPTPESVAMTFVGSFNLTSSMQTGPINLLSHPNGVYLRESTLGHSVIDSLGKRSCIRRVPLRMAHGEVQYDDLQSGTRDYVDCSGASFRSLKFRLTDDRGSTLSLEAPLSFSLVFSPTPM